MGGEMTPLEKTLAVRVVELEAAIRRHRDERGDDRCWMDDIELYKALPEGVGDADLRLCEPDVMRANCERYIAHRHNPALPYVSPQDEIDRLMKLVSDLTRELSMFY